MCKIMEEVYEEGFERGRAVGLAEARAEKRKRAKETVKRQVSSMLKDGISLEKISEYQDIPLGEVKKIAEAVL